jgi:glutathione S-transferase
MKLYYSPGACSLASHIALREAGLPFELVQVVGRSGPKTAGDETYLSVTPKNYVPALRLDDGEVLTEGTAIMPFVADQAPSKHLAPAAGTRERYRLHEWLGYINSEVHKSYGPFFTPGASDAAKQAASDNLGRKFDFIVSQLGDRPFLLASGYSVADAYLFTILGWTKIVGVDLGKWPSLAAYHARIAARPAVIEAMKAEGLIK